MQIHDPTNLDIANRLWDELDGGVGNNLKSTRRSIMTFGKAAQHSVDGRSRLAASLMEAFDLTGVPPNAIDMDAGLIASINDASKFDENIKWLKVCIAPNKTN